MGRRPRGGRGRGVGRVRSERRDSGGLRGRRAGQRRADGCGARAGQRGGRRSSLALSFCSENSNSKQKTQTRHARSRSSVSPSRAVYLRLEHGSRCRPLAQCPGASLTQTLGAYPEAGLTALQFLSCKAAPAWDAPGGRGSPSVGAAQEPAGGCRGTPRVCGPGTLHECVAPRVCGPATPPVNNARTRPRRRAC